MAVIRALVVVLLSASVCEGYGDRTHANIVRDAIEFIISNKGDTTTKYPDGATGKSDYDLLLRILSITPGRNADARLRDIAKQLGAESVNTDRLLDVTLTIPWLLGPSDKTDIDGYSFTLFSHFIDVRFPPVFWEHDGYSYERAEQNVQCEGGAKDRLGNYLIKHSGATINTAQSSAYLSYRDPLRKGIKPEDYEKHSKQSPIFASGPSMHLQNIGSNRSKNLREV